MRQDNKYLIGLDEDGYSVRGKDNTLKQVATRADPLTASQAQKMLSKLTAENAVIYEIVPVDPKTLKRRK